MLYTKAQVYYTFFIRNINKNQKGGTNVPPASRLLIDFSDYYLSNDLYNASISSTEVSLGLPGRQASAYASLAN